MKRFIFPFFVILLFASCVSQKKISYLQDIPETYSEAIGKKQDAVVRPGDWLSILISSKDFELAQMFNLPVVTNSLTSNSIISGGTNRISGYLVDEKGCIDFPQLGILEIKGLTLAELAVMIKNKLIEGGYIMDPVVTTQYMNFNISVMGEVARPGVFNASAGRITILEALSMAGDLTIYGKRENVMVIREENGERTVASLDLRSKQIFSSPYYYLQQNDVVYVQPNKAKAGQSEINQNRTWGTFASIISVLVSLSVLIFK